MGVQKGREEVCASTTTYRDLFFVYLATKLKMVKMQDLAYSDTIDL